MSRDKRKEICCVGGPYHGEWIHLSWGCQSTLRFSAKGQAGRYLHTGRWVSA